VTQENSMPQAIQCGACQRRIRIPDNLPPNRQFQCPACGAALMLQAPAPQPSATTPFAFGESPAEAPVMLPPPEAPPSGGVAEEGPLDVDSLRSLRRGCMWHVLANGLYVLGLLLFLILYFAVSPPEPSATPSRGSHTEDIGVFVSLLSLLMLFSILGGWIGGVIAAGAWMAAPWRFGARGTAIALMVVTALVILKPSDIVTTLNPAGQSSGGKEPGAAVGLAFIALFYVLEGARLYLLGSFIHAAGRNVRRGSPPTAGANILALVAPVVLGLVFLVEFFMVQTEMSKGKVTTILILNVFGLAAVLAWGIVSLFTLSAALGRLTARR
jgi:hypothetical protein